MRTAVVLALTLALAGCANRQPNPPVKGSATVGQTVIPTAKPPTTQGSWLAVDRSCRRSADCLGVYKMWADGQRCCRSCQTDAVARSWIAAAERSCAAAGSEGCPTKKCAALAKVECRQHLCQVKR